VHRQRTTLGKLLTPIIYASVTKQYFGTG